MEKQERKIKLIYSIELLVFAVAFLVLGILELLAVIKLSERFQLIFKIITLVGATWLVTDFVWVMVSPKRKKKNSILDKSMMLPLAIYLYVFDILGFVLKPGYGYYQIGVPAAFIYISCVYTFQGIYHYFKPVPAIIETIEGMKESEEDQKENPEQVNENAQEENKEEN